MAARRKSQQAQTGPICGARTRKGTPCQRPAGWGTDHPGIGRCKLHGGATPRGADSPHFKHGLRCRYLPPSPEELQDVTEEDLMSAVEEAVAAVKWLEHFTRSPGPKPPLTVLAALRTVVQIKREALDIANRLLRDAPLSSEVIADLVSQLILAMENANVPQKYRRAIAQELLRIARSTVGGQAGAD